MVQELERTRPKNRQKSPFPEAAPAAYPVFYRTYSRRFEGGRREAWQEVCDRTLKGLVELGKLTDEEHELVSKMQRSLKAMPSGRWLWVGGTDWSKNPKNFSGAYNCTSTNVVDWRAFGLMMDLAMMGCGTGAVLEPKYINQLPKIRNKITVTMRGDVGMTIASQRREEAEIKVDAANNRVEIIAGDSRQGWVKSYQTLLELSTDERFSSEVEAIVDLSDIRPAGEQLKGFGGMANPVKLPELYERCAKILNNAIGRQLNSIECCLLIDEAAACVVAGNIRRSAGIRQFDSSDDVATGVKENLWQQDENGNWRIDPERDALRMANHTRVYHEKPSKEDVLNAVRKQFHSGEGAIQWAGEAERRAQGKGRYGLNPCVTADTWVHTGDGPCQVQDLIGQQHSTYINGELFSTTADGFFFSGEKPVVKLATQEGFELRLTENHQVLRVTAQTQKKQYTEWTEAGKLQSGDYILLHDHRNLQAWDGVGSHDEGWLLGSLIGDGSLAKTQWNDVELLRYREKSSEEMSQYAIQLLGTAVGYEKRMPEARYHKQLKHRVVNSTRLAKLAACFGIMQGNKNITNAVEQTSYEFYCGFLKGLFDADGRVQGTQLKGVSVRLAQSNLSDLKAVQRMLARLGIISKIYQERRPEQYRMLPDTQRQPAEYLCKAQHELIIGKGNLHHFQQVVGFREPQKSAKLDELLGGYKRKLNRERFVATVQSIESDGVEKVYDCTVPGPSCFDANGLMAHNCGEIIGENFHCNLAEIHLNRISHKDEQAQNDAFKAGAIAVAALLNHQFQEPRYQHSREADPIVGVSFTGFFDFCVKAFGVEWLLWFEAGRPDTMQGLDFKAKEEAYLSRWKKVVHETVWEYCDRHQIRRPNRCTTVQPAGTKSLLTGASSGWHPPKAQRFIRRITFRKDDPVALACIDYGYSVIPSQSDKDENGNLLNDPFDPRCTEWLVELPVEVDWANLPGADEVPIEKFSALAQFDFYMQVQKHYTAHNTSATVELREHEIEPLAERIYDAIENDEGYISAALLARFDDVQTFPRLPFEPITKARYEEMLKEVRSRRVTDNFHTALEKYDAGELVEAGPAGCDSDKCLMPEAKPS